RKAKLRAPTCAACAALCVRSTWTTRRSNSPKNARWQRRKRMPESNGVNVASALEIALRDDRGEIRKLADFRGRNVVLYFYPMDDTPGCTVEGKEFRELHDQFLALDTVVIGVSTDSVERHRAFADKHAFPFILLADTEGRLASAFGVFN